MAKKLHEVRIAWNGQGGELDSAVVVDDGESSVANALIRLVKDNIVSVGDTFTVEAVE